MCQFRGCAPFNAENANRRPWSLGSRLPGERELESCIVLGGEGMLPMHPDPQHEHGKRAGYVTAWAEAPSGVGERGLEGCGGASRGRQTANGRRRRWRGVR